MSWNLCSSRINDRIVNWYFVIFLGWCFKFLIFLLALWSKAKWRPSRIFTWPLQWGRALPWPNWPGPLFTSSWIRRNRQDPSRSGASVTCAKRWVIPIWQWFDFPCIWKRILSGVKGTGKGQFTGSWILCWHVCYGFPCSWQSEDMSDLSAVQVRIQQSLLYHIDAFSVSNLIVCLFVCFNRRKCRHGSSLFCPQARGSCNYHCPKRHTEHNSGENEGWGSHCDHSWQG